MTEPTEAEIEAATEAVCATEGQKICHPDAMVHCLCRVYARAALTAAAQVRERADLDAVKDMKTWPDSVRREHGLMPIYSATEDPQATDIVVQCKCGWCGPQSSLIWVSTTSTSRFCPQCSAEFTAQPATEHQGEDVLGMRKGEGNT